MVGKTRVGLEILARAGLEATHTTIIDGGYQVGQTFIATNDLAKTMFSTVIIAEILWCARQK